MKTTIQRPRPTRLLLAAAAIVGGMLTYGATARADQGNQLANPGFETGSSTGWITAGDTEVHGTNDTYYNQGECAPDLLADYVTTASGGYCGKLFGYGSTSGVNTYWRQNLLAGAGSTWSASGWALSSHEDLAGGLSSFWFEVDFLNSTNGFLAAYRSYMITNLVCPADGTSPIPLDTWLQLAVTNQVALNATGTGSTAQTIGTAPNGVLTAPAGTASVRYQASFQQQDYINGSVFIDDCDLDLISGSLPPSFANVYPNGPFQQTNYFTFTVSAAGSPAAPIPSSNVHVALNGFDVTSLMTLTGNTNSWVGSVPILSNYVYGAMTVTASNSLGWAASVTVSFDTFSQANFMWEGEDYDFNGGQFIDDPVPSADADTDAGSLVTGALEANSYFGNPGGNSGNAALNGIDAYDPDGAGGYHNYRADFVGSQQSGDFLRQKFINAQTQSGDPNIADFNLGWFNAGDWANYTRHYPLGTYNVYGRLAGGSGPFSGATMNLVTGGWGTTNQTTSLLGYFADSSPAGWETYHWVPMLDVSNNLAKVTFTAATNTLKYINANACNVNFFMLVPAVASQSPVLQSVYPNAPFEGTNTFAFTLSAGSGSPIPSANIHLTLNGVDVTSQLTLSGSPLNWNGSIPVALNAFYTAVLVAANSAGLVINETVNFDTFSANYYTWEATDYDFNGGQFIDNPVLSADTALNGGALTTGTLLTNSYYGYPGGDSNNVALSGIDAYDPDGSGGYHNYRADFVGSQTASDFVRQNLISARAQLSDPSIAEFNLGWFNGGDWANYTRHYPPGTYYIYARLAGGGAAFSGASMNLVTGGWGTANQTATVLGYFADANPLGWETYHTIQMLDTNNHPATVQLTGPTNTLKFINCNSVNVLYFMLAPVVTPPAAVSLSAMRVGSQVNLSFGTQADHAYTVLYATSLSKPVAWTTLTVVTGDGAAKVVTDSIGGTARFYRVLAQ
ncbi:MAG: hypothetical protein ABSH34_23125 [Verrucomicrobiota bacterium]|jgi:hypothetical protein